MQQQQLTMVWTQVQVQDHTHTPSLLVTNAAHYKQIFAHSKSVSIHNACHCLPLRTPSPISSTHTHCSSSADSGYSDDWCWLGWKESTNIDVAQTSLSVKRFLVLVKALMKLPYRLFTLRDRKLSVPGRDPQNSQARVDAHDLLFCFHSTVVGTVAL